jgi:hypothetical protein
MLALLDVSNTAYGNAMACVCVQRDTRRISAQKIRFLRENHCVAAARNACRSAAPSLIWRWISTIVARTPGRAGRGTGSRIADRHPSERGSTRGIHLRYDNLEPGSGSS